ncbi:hypothetical protein [uncultured Ruminococcus sp.]|uniref:hypothetical protein n=1 Tax=uncultured Ruminococcus sp. TaxID=165186 RepID=UPI0026369652|nr:hypothetical protein [uncultured Ruminococcus sp.]
MIEKIILDWLSAELDVPVYLEEPKELPERYVLIDKLGSTENDFITSATIAVQSYSASLYGAAELNAKVKKAMAESVSQGDICRCACTSDYNYTDTETKRYRYQAVFDITYYEE